MSMTKFIRRFLLVKLLSGYTSQYRNASLGARPAPVVPVTWARAEQEK